MSNIKNKISAVFEDGIKIISRRYIELLAACIVLFGIIWLGYTIRVVGSREICDSVAISFIAKDNIKLDSHPVVKLSHAGNIVLLSSSKTSKNTWAIDRVFIEKFFLVIKNEELKEIQSVRIAIGGKPFFADNSDLTNWRLSDPGEKSAYFDYDKTTEFVVGLPDQIHSEVSHLPFFNKLFGKVVNWAGDHKLVFDPLISAIKLFVLIVLALILYFFLFLMFLPKSDTELNVPAEGQQRVNFLSFCLALVFTIGALLLLNLLIIIFYKPDVNLILNQAREAYLPHLLSSFVPKPVERLQFILSVVASPFLLAFFYKTILIKLKATNEKVVAWLYNFFVPISVLLVFALAFCGLAMSDFLYIKNSYFVNPFGKYLYTLFLFPLLFWLSMVYESNEHLKKIITPLPYVFIVFIIFAVFSLSIFNFNNIPGGPYHFNPIFYPIAQVFGGKTLLVGFGSLYGLFPIFLDGIFKIVGLSVFKITLVMASLLALSYLALFVFLKNTVKDKLVLLAGISSVFFFSYYSVPAFYNQSPVYFQYWPIRFLPACIFIFLVSSFIKAGSRKLFYYLSFAWCCLSLLWNLETGLVMLMSWALILAYCEFSQAKQRTITEAMWAFIKQMSKHLGVFLGFLIFTIIGFILHTYLRSGSFPNPEFFYKYQKLFFSGYFMIPMLPPPHTWSLIVFTYLAGMLYSIRALFLLPTEKSKIIFFLSILGLGLFSYYEGRSHDWTLIAPSFTAVLLCTIFADELLALAKKNIYPAASMAILILLLFFLYGGPVSLATKLPKIGSTIKANYVSLAMKDSPLAQNISFIKQNSSAREKIFILSANYDGVYYTETGTISAADLPSSTEYFSKKEAEYIISFLRENAATKIFADLNNPIPINNEIDGMLKDYYKILKTSEGGMALLVKK